MVAGLHLARWIDMDEARALGRHISGVQMFFLAFLFTFSGVMTNLAAFHWIELYLDRREVNQPSEQRETGEPRLADLETTWPLGLQFRQWRFGRT